MRSEDEKRVNLVFGLLTSLPENAPMSKFDEILGLLSHPDLEIQRQRELLLDEKIKSLPRQMTFNFG